MIQVKASNNGVNVVATRQCTNVVKIDFTTPDFRKRYVVYNTLEEAEKEAPAHLRFCLPVLEKTLTNEYGYTRGVDYE